MGREVIMKNEQGFPVVTYTAHQVIALEDLGTMKAIQDGSAGIKAVVELIAVGAKVPMATAAKYIDNDPTNITALGGYLLRKLAKSMGIEGDVDEAGGFVTYTEAPADEPPPPRYEVEQLDGFALLRGGDDGDT